VSTRTKADMRLDPSALAAEHHNLPTQAAVTAWLDALARTGAPPRLESVTVPVREALGSVLAEPVWAVRCSPAFPAAAMDGIAVAAADTVGARPGRALALVAEAFDAVDTGNPLPPGRDAVVMREQVRFDGAMAEIEAEASPGQHVRSIGEDIAAGEELLVPGHRLRGIDLAVAAAGGVKSVTVRRAARVAILPTGDELRPAEATLAPGELADTNSLMLEGIARESGCDAHVWPILPDDPDRLTEALAAATERADLVLLVAGTSAGRHDYVPEVIHRCGRIVVHGVAIRPGHPAVLGVAGGTAVMGCPGYPVSAALAFEELARPLIAWLEGTVAPRRPAVAARLAADVRSKRGGRSLLRVRIGSVDGHRVAVPLRGGASVLSSLVHADALVPIPEDQDAVAASARIEAELLPGTSERGTSLLLAGAPERALELLAIVFAESQGPRARLAFCEVAPAQAVPLVRDRMCHAAAVGRVGSAAPSDDLLRVEVASCEVGLVFGAGSPRGRDPRTLLRGRARVAVGPPGTPARDVLDDAARRLDASALELVEVRSDAVALATVTAGYADFAVSTVPAAAERGLATSMLGRAALDLLIKRDLADRDLLVRALVATARSRSFEVVVERAGYQPRVRPAVAHAASRARAVQTVNMKRTPEVPL
jgi:putative molybdopterin biosynthesis protein